MLGVFSLVLWNASSVARAQTAPLLAVVESSYTSTSPVVSRMWMEDIPKEEAVVASIVVPQKPIKTQYVDITAYSSAVEECDSDPFVAADGSVVFDGMVAANFLPFGTKIRLPDYYGDKVFEVRDRMNARYTYRIDIWMANKKDTFVWGVKRKTKVEILEMGTNAHKWNDPEMKEARKQIALQN